MIVFGAGDVWLKEATGTNPKTIKAGTLKGASLDMGEETVKMYGNKKYPKDVANGQGTLTGKLSLGEIEPALVKAVLAGSTEATGYEEMVTQTGAIPATPFQITVTGLKEDYGVRYLDSGLSLLRVASAPAVGQYSVVEGTGVYTFASADNVAGKSVEINGVKDVVGSGSTVTYTNQLMGSGSTWKLRLWNTYGTRKIGYYLPAVKIGKGGLNFQSDAHAAPEYDFEAFESSDGTVFKLFSL
jgi:hypothetical protein